MKIIQFLLIITFAARHLQLLDDLKQSSFGQSLEQTILLQFQQYDTNIMYQEQIIDDANLKQEYDNCNTNDLQNEIITIKYEESSIKQKMKLLNNSFELQVSQKKLKELQFNQEQLNQYNKQIEKEKENQRSNLKKCDELLENTQYLRFQYEKKVLNQLTFRRTNTYYIKIGDAKSYKNYQQYDKKTVQTCIFKNNLTRQLRFKVSIIN
ncbi:unnamed protein product [Paramecium pentaurelia]|uniref:Transmembrane protein n=1 Tax=Paramecium pentaurelia TaxID=43138 RepID=A0A8S1TVY3_9CILI|nr:unnamed protein product [Paramecium pentaurelia]